MENTMKQIQMREREWSETMLRSKKEFFTIQLGEKILQDQLYQPAEARTMDLKDWNGNLKINISGVILTGKKVVVHESI
jgi:hypothetical protein